MDTKRERKIKKIEVLCTETQLKKIIKRAKELGMSNSEYGLFTMLNAKIEVNIGADPLMEKLRMAVDMLDNAKITDDEFDTIKQQIIGESRR